MEINYDEMSKHFGLSDKTIQRYVAHLQQAFLVQLSAKHSFKSKVRLLGCKSYIVDPGRQNNRENAMAAENIGWRLENVVYLELVRRARKHIQAGDFLSWKNETLRKIETRL